MTWPGEDLLIKLWETLAEKGVGGLLKPWQIRREGLAQIGLRRTELVALAEAERLADDIRSGRRSAGNLKALVSSEWNDSLAATPEPLKIPLEPVQIASGVLLADTLRAEVNVAKAIAAAEEELKDDTSEPPKQNMDSDWIHRWREYAGGVSSEELQALWGKILAGELKSPGKYGYRTLDFIRSLSAEEAAKIEIFSRFVLDGLLPRNHLNFLESAGINFSDMLELQNLGLVSGVEAIGMTVSYKSSAKDRYFKALCSHGKVLLIRADDPNKVLECEIYGIPNLGRQVMSLGKFEPHEDYLRAVGNEIKAKGFTVALADYVLIEPTRIKFTNEVPL